jgi:hypothetical protein
MSRRGSRRQRHRFVNTLAGGADVALKPPPGSRAVLRPSQSAAAAIPLPVRPEPLVAAPPALSDMQSGRLDPLPPSLSLVDPRQPITRRLRLWFYSKAERWVERHRPMPEAPTIAQLDRLRKDLAGVQRRLDKMLG